MAFKGLGNHGVCGATCVIHGSWSSCDNGQCPKRVLQFAKGTKKAPQHAFEDIEAQLPADARAIYDSLLPEYSGKLREIVASVELQDKLKTAHAKHRAYLTTNVAKIWKKSNRSKCSTHEDAKRGCLFFNPDPDDGEGRSCWRANVTGSCCIPWASQGLQLGWCHPSVRLFWIHISKMFAGHFKVWGLENSGRLPTDDVVELAAKHCFGSVVLSVNAADIGYCASRSRSLIMFFAHSEFVCCLPVSRQKQQDAFDACFSAPQGISADALAGMDLEGEASEIAISMQRRGVVGCTKPLEVPLAEQLPPGCMRTRLRRYEGKFKQQQQHQPQAFLQQPQAFLGDLSQAGDDGHLAFGPLMRPLSRSSVSASLSAATPFIFSSQELEVSQGWPTPVSRSHGGCYEDCCLVNIDQYFSSCATMQVSLRGNGMHLCSMGAWISFTLGHLLCRADVERMDPTCMWSLSPSKPSWLESEDEADSL